MVERVGSPWPHKRRTRMRPPLAKRHTTPGRGFFVFFRLRLPGVWALPLWAPAVPRRWPAAAWLQCTREMACRQIPAADVACVLAAPEQMNVGGQVGTGPTERN